MSLNAGTRLGPYEIQSALGAGGMGEVYRARDTRLNRDVALKVLPTLFALDADRLARFKREAQVLASLNHPNIAAIYGLEESEGVQALVLELVDGPTLADRIAHGAVPVDEALAIATQIASALEAAHEHGIIHRDLKPANVKVRADGAVKVLDFGLAKALEGETAAASVSHSPTLSVAATRLGVILGTAAYMAPEQAKGKAVDKRVDIWGFGCVLFEMLSGRQPFAGDTVTETLAEVMKSEPRWDALPVDLPQRVLTVLRRCFEKEPSRRVRDIGDVRLALEGAFDALPSAGPMQTRSLAAPLWRRVLPVAITAIVFLAIGGGIVWNLRRPPASGGVTRFSLETPAVFGQPAFSPDGSQLVYVAGGALVVRSMGEMEARPVAGTSNLRPGNPVFSPDGQWVAFASGRDQTLKKIALAGGPVLTICKAESNALLGMSWQGNRIVYSLIERGIFEVSADGGEPEVLVATTPPEIAAFPQILEDGQAMLFTMTTEPGANRWQNAQVMIQALPAGERQVVLRGASAAEYVPTGHIVYAVGETLLAVPFDLKNRRTVGGPIPVVEDVLRGGNNSGSAAFAFSASGSFAYIPTNSSLGAFSDKTLALVDRNGNATPLALPPAPYYHPRFSPDGSQLLVGTDDGTEAVIWIYDLKGGGAARRLTFGGRNTSPIWTPDGRRVTFHSDRDGDLGLFWQLADGSGSAERLTKPEPGIDHRPEAWSPDGRTLAFLVTTGGGAGLGAGDIWTLSLDGERTPKPLVDGPIVNQRFTAFSPNGRWFAYVSTEVGGRMETFVQPFPPTGAKYQVSTDAGRTPVWSPNGREIFFDSANRIAAVAVETAPTFKFGKPVPLPVQRPILLGPGRNFDISPDGRQFIVVLPVATSGGDPDRGQINVTLNWFEELRRRVPVN